MKKCLITITCLFLITAAFSQSAPSAPKKLANITFIDAEYQDATLPKPTPPKPLAPRPPPAVEALTLRSAPVTQQVSASPEIPAPSSMLPTAKAQAKTLPAADAARLAAAQRWEQSGAADALVGASGAVEYPYGFSRPTITCAPLHVCSVALQDGESVTSVSVGDTVRWLLQNATAGAKPVLMIKPTQAGLSTNLVVTTDKGRIYYMHLVSSKTEYVPMVTWYDPAAMTRDLRAEADAAARQKAEFEASIAATKIAADQAKSQRVVADKSAGKLDPTELDFGYSCNGDADFKPVRVFSNATHTFVQLPPGAAASDAPAVFNTTNKDAELLNSRLVNGYYIIDGKPAKLSLVLGVGGNAKTVVCEKNSSNRFGFNF